MKNCSCKGRCGCRDCRCGASARLFDTLGNRNRLHLITALRDRPRTVSQLVTATGLEQSMVSHSLRALEEATIVQAERQGKFRIYTLNHRAAEPLLALIDKLPALREPKRKR